MPAANNQLVSQPSIRRVGIVTSHLSTGDAVSNDVLGMCEQLQSIEAELDVLDEYSDGVTNILMVGRLAPSKGHADLIEAFAAYHHDYNPQSRLLIVGKELAAFENYSKRLRELMAYFLVED